MGTNNASNANIAGIPLGVPPVADDDILVYDSAGPEWVAEPKPAAGVSDHGALAGLGDDDHTIYFTTARADTWLTGKTTTDLTEGTNLYYTEGKVSANSDVSANTIHRNTITGNPHNLDAADVNAAPTVHGHTAGDISDFDTEVSNNTDVAANTSHRGLVSGNPHAVTASEVGAIPDSAVDNQVAVGNATGTLDYSDTLTFVNGLLKILKDGNLAQLALEQFDASGVPCIELRTHRGTQGAPADVVVDDSLGELLWKGRTAGTLEEYAQIIAEVESISPRAGRIIAQIIVAGSYEDRMEICCEGVCIRRDGSDGPVLYLQGDSNADYGASLRYTGEPTPGTYRGAYTQYDAAANELIFGVHDTDDTVSANDTECIRIHRSPLGLITYKARASAPSSGDLNNGEIAFYLEEGTNTLKFAAKESGGTFGQGTVGTY